RRLRLGRDPHAEARQPREPDVEGFHTPTVANADGTRQRRRDQAVAVSGRRGGSIPSQVSHTFAAMDRLRVLTLNIWNRQGPWERRLVLIRRGIEQLQPDLIGLQEVLHHESTPIDQASAIAEGFGYHSAFGAAWD